MGAISEAKAVYALSASGTPAALNSSGTNTVGVSQTSQAFTSADILYSVKISADDVDDVATLVIATGDVTQTTGTPSVTRRGTETDNLTGFDFDGADIGSISTLYAILIEVNVGGPDLSMTYGGESFEPSFVEGVSRKAQLIYPSGVGIQQEALVFTWGDTASPSDDYVIVTVCGSST